MSGYGKTLGKSDSVAKICSLRRHGDLRRDGRERLLAERTPFKTAMVNVPGPANLVPEGLTLKAPTLSKVPTLVPLA
jgi:hypothetical protein